MKKQKIIQTINEFPREVDLNDLFERLIVTDKIEKGLQQIENGETVSHDKVVAHFKKKWQK
jgi:predicted transcriptional regulator